jgi:putative transposase
MHHLTTTHATRWNRAHGLTGTGHVYQGPYKYFPVEQDEHYYPVSRYIVRNALRAGLVTRAEDWPWCSLWTPAKVPLSEAPLPVGSQWLDWVNEPQSEEELAAVRESVRRGSPFGNDAWQKQIALEMGLTSTLRGRGRSSRRLRS